MEKDDYKHIHLGRATLGVWRGGGGGRKKIQRYILLSLFYNLSVFVLLLRYAPFSFFYDHIISWLLGIGWMDEWKEKKGTKGRRDEETAGKNDV